ncbi:hypothetical protein BD413DRAFT_527802 [Trametes elegans]|nr:hypothetical protein BD413DRAFT_527802 [Trametes elegans]
MQGERGERRRWHCSESLGLHRRPLFIPHATSASLLSGTSSSRRPRMQLIEEANKADSGYSDTERADNEFQDRFDAAEKMQVENIRRGAPRCEGPVSRMVYGRQPDWQEDKIDEAPLDLFQDACEKRNADVAALSELDDSEKKEEKKDEVVALPSRTIPVHRPPPSLVPLLPSVTPAPQYPATPKNSHDHRLS